MQIYIKSMITYSLIVIFVREQVNINNLNQKFSNL